MPEIKTYQLIWIISLLLIFQSFWLEFRLNKLIKSSPKYLMAQTEKKIDEGLKKVPEPKIEQTLAKGASLWLKPAKADFNAVFQLEIWVKSQKPIERADLRLFYPQDYLQVMSPDWQVDKAGLVSWSALNIANMSSGATSEKGFLLTTISFQPLKQGSAKIDFDFSKESLLDSNLIDSEAKDVLEQVGGGEYYVSKPVNQQH